MYEISKYQVQLTIKQCSLLELCIEFREEELVGSRLADGQKRLWCGRQRVRVGDCVRGQLLSGHRVRDRRVVALARAPLA